MASDGETIDVGPVWCPTCKREYGNTEAEALREALRIAVAALPILHQTNCSGTWEADWPPTGPCDCESGVALAAVRELVDLGEKP